MKRERPLVEALEKFIKQEPYSLHVPGHKNGHISYLPADIQHALRYDVTELTGLDDFHQPEEAIAEAEELLRQTYGADRSFFLVNGSTIGNLAMIYAVCQKGDTVLVQRNAHKSIFHALELVGVQPVYLTPEWDELTYSATHIHVDVVKEALQHFQDVKAVILTSPTYYGVVTEHLKLIIDLCHTYQIPVLVDEAHGAHFCASTSFPVSALTLGADVVVQSAHKTLPAMTMASFLHVKSSLVEIDKVNRYLRMLQSSSPSYLLLASLDDARHYVSTYIEADAHYLMEKRAQWIESLRAIDHLTVIEVDDPLKLLLRVSGYTGFQLKEKLEKNHLYVELADTEQVLAILPLLKRGETYPFADMRIRIKEAVKELLTKEGAASPKLSTQFSLTKITIPEYSFQELAQLEKEWIPYMHAIGRVAASMIIPYPPGIPLFILGEKITLAKLSQLEELLAIGAAFQGDHQLNKKQIYVIK
ncbi:aminotransferase class I/II-fold pyridoxal phosphate-dependent enzyme [Metasolibacillus sp.]|uniref:aminotransferase class I/II-fold pyridoxal phosphate-dependent enzyme n=1 Tax=Metasolibacillus sp. TaxID=2703680 RepID=UPI0025D8610C|nr:aminotransferase class I/II-fold pyridoxal phosphate-dependent enzyme [Metasolibacillus sp.]MCT6926041.1 aminotransferase class I/II-fold pyridoxal phosphate-dependent enzyme [Metasolibacillus sp.]MCT6942239.1 aminotransferase class I/II-fold pyridoxal phosphate-dependent enzyme [Metasolibacillus sp.]